MQTLIKKNIVTNTHNKLKQIGMQIKKHKASYIMMAPFYILFTIFVIIPVLASVGLSFTYFNMLQPPKWVGISNYSRLFLDDDVFILAIKKTFMFALITGPLGYILSFIFAWFLNELSPKIRAFLTLVFYSPTLAGGSMYFIWKFIFSGDRYGLVNSRLMNIGIIRTPIQWLTNTDYNVGVIILIMLWLSMGAGFLAFIAGLQVIDKKLYEAAAIDGIKNRWQELFYITLPQMVPQLLFGAVMSISSSFAVGYQSMALTEFPSTDYSLRTILLHMIDYGTLRFEMGYASAIAVILFIIMQVTWKIINSLLNKI